MDKVVERVTNKMKKTVKESVDKAVKSEMLTFKEVVNADIDKLNTRLDTLSIPKSDDLSLHIVVRNVPESENENVNNKLKAVIKEGIKLQGIQVAHAVRKRTQWGNYSQV